VENRAKQTREGAIHLKRWYRKTCCYCRCDFACHGECGTEHKAETKTACYCGACIQDMEKETGKAFVTGKERCKSRMDFGILAREKVEFT